MFLPLTGMPILKSARMQAVVGSLATRAVDRRDGDAEVVHARWAIADIAELGTVLGLWGNLC